MPVALSELGASAGLNRMLEPLFPSKRPRALSDLRRVPSTCGRNGAARPPPARPLRVVDRGRAWTATRSDATNPDDALRLLSYLWPDQPERMALTCGAIALGPKRPDEGDAAPWLESRLAAREPGRLHAVYTTIAWQYFPPQTQATCTHRLEQAGARATAQSPLAHIAFEADGRRDGAALTIRLWPHAPAPQTLARADFHGRWVDLARLAIASSLPWLLAWSPGET